MPSSRAAATRVRACRGWALGLRREAYPAHAVGESRVRAPPIQPRVDAKGNQPAIRVLIGCRQPLECRLSFPKADVSRASLREVDRPLQFTDGLRQLAFLPSASPRHQFATAKWGSSWSVRLHCLIA